MVKKILITGGSGLLALNWAATLREQYSVTLGLHDRCVSLAGVATEKLDLESPEAIASNINAGNYQLVLHSAGLTSVEECESKPDLAHHVNVTLAKNVAKACVKTGVSQVHISTDHLFHGTEALLDEDSEVGPVNTYGFTKAEAERQVLEVNPGALVIRTNFYGWGSSYRHSFSDVLLTALRSGKGIALFQDVFYTPILIEVLASAVMELEKLNAFGVYNVVGDQRLSKYNFGLMIAERFGLDASLIRPARMSHQVSSVQRPLDMSLSNNKVCAKIGRTLGGVSEQIGRLFQQEQNGLAQELRQL